MMTGVGRENRRVEERAEPESIIYPILDCKSEACPKSLLGKAALRRKLMLASVNCVVIGQRNSQWHCRIGGLRHTDCRK